MRTCSRRAMGEGEGAKADSEFFALLILNLKGCAGFAGTKISNGQKLK